MFVSPLAHPHHAILLDPGALLAIWTARDDRPGWACAQVEAFRGQGRIGASGRQRDLCAVISPLWAGGGAIELQAQDTQYPRREPARLPATGTTTHLLLPLLQSVALWMHPDGARWCGRIVMANANTRGFWLTGGQGGPRKPGVMRMCIMEGQEPPADAWTLDMLIRDKPVTDTAV